MAAYVWNADATLRITDALRGSVTCIGRAARRFDARCGWRIDAQSASDAAAARNLLRVMSESPPTAVTSAQLHKLANHCLCECHKEQIDRAKSELKSYLAVAVQAYEQYRNATRQHEAFRTQLLEPLGLPDDEESDETVIRRVRSVTGLAD
ncbi:uncharacterized protein Z520_00112 [Fonsecaea multimorphosa CBS 102226]|uniref:Uncharacterized protein n=1 Tax=Fonsecaea multimorphosa CBS 102226 TaxID=1442371 RepID=A0A0D2HNP9_9EURO|nr:uncharacterized protein Z520_00112 [Fonsecaea multimorphosa CBS 102226]KIY03421.1 hypothetical protein Z520_00112 [Fonsecaea multimorphosa CBS 102226]OAL33070.1 hypothetical protein AYO22_00155 [Fonsecaea multimorphosa]